MHYPIRKSYWAATVVLLLVGFFFPTSVLMQKPANTDASYALGWQEGCHSGINAYSPIRSILESRPFVTRLEDTKSNYKSGWNEGYTTCRFAQDSVNQWVMLWLLVVTFLFARASRSDK